MSLLWQVDHFLVGMLLADIYVFYWNEAPKKSRIWDCIGGAAWFGLIYCQLSELGRVVIPLIVIVAFASSFRGVMLSQLLSQRFIAVTGGMCYTIYLYHFYVISFVGKLVVPRLAEMDYFSALAVQFSLVLPLVWGVCAILFVAFERPFMMWKPRPKMVLGSADSRL